MRKFIVLALAGVASVAMAQEVKAPNDLPTVRGVAPAPTGGPDTFGYVYADSTTEQCAFDFIDISATGTSVVSGDDSAAAVNPPMPEPTTMASHSFWCRSVILMSSSYR